MAIVRLNPRITTSHQAMDLRFNHAATDAVVKAINGAFRRHSAALFKTEGADGGTRWPALSAAYKKRKAKLRPGRKILVFDGELRRAMTMVNHPETIATWYPGPKGIVVKLGTQNAKAAWHGDTTQHNPVLPVRSVVQRSDSQVAEYRRLAVEAMRPHLIRALRDRMAVLRRG